MDNKQVTAEWIAQQRQISEIVNMTYEDAPGSVVPLLKQLEKSQTAALDALEASMQREAEKDADITTQKNIIELLKRSLERLTAERDAEKRRADAGAIRTAVRPFEKGDKNTLTKYTQFCKRLAASRKPEMPSGDRMLLLLTDLCIDRLCVSMQGLTAERDAAVCDLKYLSGEYKLCDTCKHNHGKGVWDCNDGLCDKENHYEWRGPTSANTDAPTGAERHNPIQDVSMGGMNIHNYGDVTNQQFISIDTVDKDLNL